MFLAMNDSEHDGLREQRLRLLRVLSSRVVLENARHHGLRKQRLRLLQVLSSRVAPKSEAPVKRPVRASARTREETASGRPAWHSWGWLVAAAVAGGLSLALWRL